MGGWPVVHKACAFFGAKWMVTEGLLKLISDGVCFSIYLNTWGIFRLFMTNYVFLYFSSGVCGVGRL